MTGWTSIAHNHILHQVVARNPRQCRIPISTEDRTITPFRDHAKRNSGSLRVDIVVFVQKRRHPHLRLLYIDPDRPHHNKPLREYLVRSLCQVHGAAGYAIRDAASTKKNTYRGTFPAISHTTFFHWSSQRAARQVWTRRGS